MTIPIFPIPDTRPGFSTQAPGDVGALSGGIDAILRALIQGTSLNQGQQRIDVDRAQLEEQARYYQGLIANQQAQQRATEAARAAKLRGEAEIGTGLQALLAPGPVLPAGGLKTIQGPGPTLDQVLGTISPENRAEFLKSAEPVIKRQTEEQTRRQQEAVYGDFLKSLPPEARPAGMTLVLARQSGMDDATARDLFRTVWEEAATPALLGTILRKHPDWATLPVPKQVTLYVDEQMRRTEARFRPPDRPDRPERPTEGERRAAALYRTGRLGFETLERVLETGKGVPGWSAQQLARAGFGVGNVMTKAEFRRMRQASRVLADAWLRYTSGAAVPETEVERFSQGFIPEAGDDAETLVQKKAARRAVIEALRDAGGRAIPPRYPENPY